MPKGSSGAAQEVQRVINNFLNPQQSGTFTPIDPASFKNLADAERQFRNQPVEHIAIFDNIGASPIAAGSGDGNSVGIPPGVDLAGTTVTHNHPNPRWGGTMSFADMSLINEGVRSLRAVGRQGEGGYIVRAGANARGSDFYNRVISDRQMLEARMHDAGNRAATQGLSARGIRQAAVGVIHSYYRTTARQYGFTYLRRRRMVRNEQ